MDKKVRLLIADDHAVVRAGLRLLLDSQPDIEVLGEARDGEAALREAKRLKPDIVLMDIAMPGMNGLEATRALKSENPEIQVMALSMHADDRYFFQMLQAGASGYIIKGAEPAELLAAIRTVARHQPYIYPGLVQKLMRHYQDETAATESLLEKLSPRETEILKLIAEGLSGREIGEKLFLSPHTVERHRANIMEKLGLHNKAHLIKFAIQMGLTRLESAD
ncbi:MAG: response regulator transcription factor [Chloroflexi bacterium]|nr:response regulator transcription factor [Chloroflexota bacterium]